MNSNLTLTIALLMFSSVGLAQSKTEKNIELAADKTEKAVIKAADKVDEGAAKELRAIEKTTRRAAE